jgi:curved DNA-binding protein
MIMDYKDYYQVLGVAKNASEKEIKSAYRTLARQYHPDKNPGDKAAEQRFKEVSEAYTVLSDPDKRKKYDRFGAQWQQYERAGVNPEDMGGFGGFGGFGGGQGRTVSPEEFEQMFGGGGSRGNGDFSDFFESLFGGGAGTRQGTPFEGFTGQGRGRGRRRGQDIESQAQVTLEEAYRGTTRLLQRQDGHRMEVNIPPGVKTGSRVRMSGGGGQSMGGPPGDLYLVVEVLPHAQFQREGDDLTVKVDVDLYSAILGGEVQVPTLDRPVMLTIPAGTPNGKRFRLRGLGMPKMKQPDQRGDLYAEVNVVLPEKLSQEERRLFEQLQALRR